MAGFNCLTSSIANVVLASLVMNASAMIRPQPKGQPGRLNWKGVRITEHAKTHAAATCGDLDVVKEFGSGAIVVVSANPLKQADAISGASTYTITSTTSAGYSTIPENAKYDKMTFSKFFDIVTLVQSAPQFQAGYGWTKLIRDDAAPQREIDAANLDILNTLTHALNVMRLVPFFLRDNILQKLAQTGVNITNKLDKEAARAEVFTQWFAALIKFIEAGHFSDRKARWVVVDNALQASHHRTPRVEL